MLKNVNLLMCGVLCLSGSALADMPDEQVVEVEHLLAYVENSDCTFIRNGDQHAAADSLAHILKKYDYYRNDIDSTEDFIAYSATKSILSGKYYKVECDGEKMVNTSDWLLSELGRFRQSR